MKIVITGHTKGIGKVLYDHFQNNENIVIGLSRSNDYDLTKNLNKILEIAEGCDLFINNAAVDDVQIRLLESLHKKVKKMIVLGSIAGDYDSIINSDYSKNKKDLAQRVKELSLQPENNLLHLNISMLEDAESSDNLISFQEVVNTIDFWIKNPRITKIDFEFKLTKYTLEKIKEKFKASQESIDYILNNTCEDNRKHL